MKLFTTIYDDARLLGHFLAHYRHVGVTEFFIAVAGELGSAVRPFMSQFHITVCEDLGVADQYPFGVNATTEMRRRYQAADEWAIVVDIDEFVEFPSPIDDIIAAAAAEGANVVQGIMYDRFSADGQPRGFSSPSDLASLYPVKTRFIRDVMKGADWKGVLVRGDIRPAGNFHNWEGQVVYSEIIEISHYKWTTDRIIERVRADYQITSEMGLPSADEYKRVLDHYEQNGRFAWEQFGGQLSTPSAHVGSVGRATRASYDSELLPEDGHGR
jgi:Glycosyl transferase family 2